MDSGGCGLLAALVIVFSVCAFIGGCEFRSTWSVDHDVLIESGHAYYHPQTGEFVLREAGESVMPTQQQDQPHDP